MDVPTIAAALGALRQITGIVQKAGQIDLVNMIVAIQQQLLEMHSKIVTLEAENKDLKEKLKIKGDILHKQNAYYIRKQDGKEDGPFCTRCWDKNKDIIRLNVFDDTAQCPECKNMYDYGAGSSNTIVDDVGMNSF